MHALDLGLLVVGDVVRELEQHRVVGRTGLLLQVLHHPHGTLVMRDHQRKEQPVEVGSLRCRKLRHLFWRRHARHRVVRVHRIVRGRIRYRLTALAQPVLHEFDFVSLRRVDAAGNIEQLRSVGAIGHQLGHLQRLVVMRNHVSHELCVCRRVAGIGNLDRLIGAQLPPFLARRTWLDNERLRGSNRRLCQQDRSESSAQKQSNRVITFFGHWDSSC